MQLNPRFVRADQLAVDMCPLQTKHPLLQSVVAELWARLGSEAFVVVDHWQEDGFAVGIERADRPGFLVYILVTPELPDRYYAALEVPPEEGSELLYADAGEHHALTLAELAVLTAKHIGADIPPQAV